MLLLRITRNQVLAVACDSSGGVGPKEHDSVKVPGSVVGKYSARTVILELTCIRASVSALTVSMAVEYNPTGMRILAGCRASLAELKSRAQVIWSSEKNFGVSSTGVGVSAVGLVRSSSLRIGCSRHGDSVALVGRPSVGEAVLEAERRRAIPSIMQAASLMRLPSVHEVIPIGSTGVLHECSVLASDSGLRFVPLGDESELEVSAGPSTALLVSLPTNAVERIARLGLPMVVIGSLKRALR